MKCIICDNVVSEVDLLVTNCCQNYVHINCHYDWFSKKNKTTCPACKIIDKNNDGFSCHICNKEIEKRKNRHLCPCGHLFHIECALTYFLSTTLTPCPTCSGKPLFCDHLNDKYEKFFICGEYDADEISTIENAKCPVCYSGPYP